MKLLKKLCRYFLKDEISLLTDRIANREKALKELSERFYKRDVKVDLYKTLTEKEVLVDDLQVIKHLHIKYANILPETKSICSQAQKVIEQMESKFGKEEVPQDFYELLENNDKVLKEQEWIVETTKRIVQKLEGIIN